MKKLLALLILVSMGFSALQVQSIGTEITLHKDGSSSVVERVTIRMNNELDLIDYTQASEVNNFENWIKVLNNKDVKLHIDVSKVSIENLRIRPQPVRTKPTGDIEGVILIMYDVPADQQTPLWIKEVEKPRKISYRLNTDVLSYERTSAGNIILRDGLVLIINFPEGSVVKDINPIPKNLREVQLPTVMEQAYWRDQILVGFRVEVSVEESLAEEISNYFENAIMRLQSILGTEEGRVYVGIGLVLIAGYLYISSKVGGIGHGSPGKE